MPEAWFVEMKIMRLETGYDEIRPSMAHWSSMSLVRGGEGLGFRQDHHGDYNHKFHP